MDGELIATNEPVQYIYSIRPEGVRPEEEEERGRYRTRVMRPEGMK